MCIRDSYWIDGDEAFADLTRNNFAFGGWYTEKGGGTKIENFEGISGDDVTVSYTHLDVYKRQGTMKPVV